MIREIGKKVIRDFLHSHHQYPTELTTAQEIREVLAKMYPIDPGIPFIRLGPNTDAGYVLPNDLEGISACFSPGVSTASGFESDCAKKGMEVYLADKSVDGPAEKNDRFHFIKKYIGAYNSEDFMALDSWVDQNVPNKQDDLILQMDIEGFEYEVFFNMSEQLQKRFRIMVIEFHSLEQLWNKPYFTLISRCFEKLLQTHYCVHYHPNNSLPPFVMDDIVMPRLMEITFLRQDRAKSVKFRTDFPSDLDYDNTKNKSLPLPKSWYKQD